MEAYCRAFNLQKYSQKMHPDSIYIEPQSKHSLSKSLTFLADGMLYFVRGNTIGSDFGFPRLGIKKKYKW